MKFSSRLREIRRKIQTVAREEDEVENRIRGRHGRTAVKEERQIEDQVIELEKVIKDYLLDQRGMEELESFVEWEEFLTQRYRDLVEAVLRASEYIESNPSVAESEIKKAERIATEMERKRTEKREEMSEDSEKLVKTLQSRERLLETFRKMEEIVQRLRTEEDVIRKPIPDSRIEEVAEGFEDIEELREKTKDLKERQKEVENQLEELHGRMNTGNSLQSLKNSLGSQIAPDIERVKRIVESMKELPEHTDELVEEVARITEKDCGFHEEEMDVEDLTMISVENARDSGDLIRMRAETRKRQEMSVQEQVEISVYVQNRSDKVQHGTLGLELPDGWTVTGVLDVDIATPTRAAKRFVLEPGQKQVLRITAWQYSDTGEKFDMFATHYAREPDTTRMKHEQYPLPQSEASVDYHERIEVIGEGRSEMPEEKVGLTARGSTNATRPKTYTLELEAENQTEKDQPIKLVVEAPDGWRLNGEDGFDDASPDTVVLDTVLEPGESIEPALSLWKHSMKNAKLRVEMTRKDDNRESVITKSLP